MAYKKYINKNGKIYGPYVYHSKRIDGKVVSEYHGLKKDKKSKKLVLILIGSFLLLFLIFWILFFTLQFSGRVVLDISENYYEGEPIKGSINLNLQKGELIPSNSKLIIENNENLQEYFLNQLISEQIQTGEFYLKEINISNIGEGYGVPGEKETIPEINFKYKIISKIDDTPNEPIEENNETNETIEEEIIEPIEENNETLEPTNEETTVEEEIIEPADEETPLEATTPSITGNVISNNPSGIKKFFARLTGKATEETIKQGILSKNNPYSYTLNEGETIEIIEATTKDLELSKNILDYEINEGKLIISTDYSEIEEGFGKEYLMEEEITLRIDFEDLSIPLEEGPIKIQIIYDEKNLMNFEEKISPKTIQTEIIITQTSIDSFELNLTNEEKEILRNNFGLIIVQTTSYKYKNKILVNFKIGENTMEHSYDLKLETEKIKSLIERDKDLWLKDLAREFSTEKTIPTEEPTFNKNYAVL